MSGGGSVKTHVPLVSGFHGSSHLIIRSDRNRPRAGSHSGAPWQRHAPCRWTRATESPQDAVKSRDVGREVRDAGTAFRGTPLLCLSSLPTTLPLLLFSRLFSVRLTALHRRHHQDYVSTMLAVRCLLFAAVCARCTVTGNEVLFFAHYFSLLQATSSVIFLLLDLLRCRHTVWLLPRCQTEDCRNKTWNLSALHLDLPALWRFIPPVHCLLRRAERGWGAAASRRGRSAQETPATDAFPGGAAPQPAGHPGKQPHSRSSGKCSSLKVWLVPHLCTQTSRAELGTDVLSFPSIYSQFLHHLPSS